MYDGRTRLSSQVADEVRYHFPDQVLRTSVPRSVRVSEAPSFGETVMTYDPTAAAPLYLEAAGELADRGSRDRHQRRKRERDEREAASTGTRSRGADPHVSRDRSTGRRLLPGESTPTIALAPDPRQSTATT